MTGIPDLLRFEGIAVHYGSLCALRAGDVALRPGAVGLLGPNGAGKSTLLKVLLGLVQPRAGRGWVLGEDIRSRSIQIRRRVGYMPENDSFVPRLSAVEFVALAGELAGMPRRQALRRAHEVLSFLGLGEVRYRAVEGYSTGMKQRFKLAQALVHDPELLILDEPTSGLDPGGRRALLDLIGAMHRDHGKSVILATHLLDDVERVCDSMLVLNSGRVIASGRIEDLRVHWRNRYRLRIEGDRAPFVRALEKAGARVLEAPRRERDGDDLLVEAPEGWRCRRFFEILADLDAAGAPGDGPGTAPILRALLPDRERVDRLFARLMAGGVPASDGGGLRGGEAGDGD